MPQGEASCTFLTQPASSTVHQVPPRKEGEKCVSHPDQSQQLSVTPAVIELQSNPVAQLSQTLLHQNYFSKAYATLSQKAHGEHPVRDIKFPPSCL